MVGETRERRVFLRAIRGFRLGFAVKFPSQAFEIHSPFFIVIVIIVIDAIYLFIFHSLR